MTLREENFVLFNGVIDEVFSTKNNLKDLEELNWITSGLADICPNGHLSECLITSIFGQMSVRTNIRFPDICPNQDKKKNWLDKKKNETTYWKCVQGLQRPDFYIGRPADFSYH